MAQVVLECKRKADGSSGSSDSEPEDLEVQEKIKKLAEEKERKMLEDETRRLKRRIERKRKHEEGSSLSSSPNQQPESTQSQFEKIMVHLKSMKVDCDLCKSLGTPKSQMDYLKAIYMRIGAIEKLLKDQ